MLWFLFWLTVFGLPTIIVLSPRTTFATRVWIIYLPPGLRWLLPHTCRARSFPSIGVTLVQSRLLALTHSPGIEKRRVGAWPSISAKARELLHGRGNTGTQP